MKLAVLVSLLPSVVFSYEILVNPLPSVEPVELISIQHHVQVDTEYFFFGDLQWTPIHSANVLGGDSGFFYIEQEGESYRLMYSSNLVANSWVCVDTNTVEYVPEVQDISINLAYSTTTNIVIPSVDYAEATLYYRPNPLYSWRKLDWASTLDEEFHSAHYFLCDSYYEAGISYTFFGWKETLEDPEWHMIHTNAYPDARQITQGIEFLQSEIQIIPQ